MKTKFVLFFALFVFSFNSYARLETRDILIRCFDKPDQKGTVTMDFDSLNWGWQCDDLEPYTRKSYVWVHPSPVVLETPEGIFEVDKAKSDKECNQGEMTSYGSEDVSCNALASEFVTRGMRVIYSKSWAVGGRNYRNGQSYYLTNASGTELYFYIELKNWYDTEFEAKGEYSKPKGKKENCTYQEI